MIELKEIEQVKFFGTPGYTTLAEAISTIGVVPTELRFRLPALVDTTITIPKHIRTKIYGKGVFDIAAGRRLTVLNLNAPRSKLAIGAGELVLGRNAVREIDMAWYVGTEDEVTLNANQQTGIWESLKLMQGGTLRLGSQGVTMAGGFEKIPNGTTIQGVGTQPDGYCSVLRLSTDNTNLFKVAGRTRNINFRDFFVDMSARVGTTGILLTPDGTPDESTIGVEIERVNMIGGQYHVYISDPAHAIMTLGIVIRRCYFYMATSACFKSDTANGGFTFDSNQIAPAWNGTSIGIDNPYAGTMSFVGTTTIDGRNYSYGDHHATFVDANVDIVNDRIQITGHPFDNANGLSNIQIEPARLYNDGGALPAGLTSGAVVYIRWFDANNVTLHLTSQGAIANTGRINITAATGGGVHVLKAGSATQIRFAAADVNTSTGQLTVRAHGYSGIGPCSFEAAALPNEWNAKQKYYFKPDDAHRGKIHYSAYEAANGYNPVIPLSQGSGLMRLMTPHAVTVDRPLAGLRIGGSHSPIMINNIQDEGLGYSLIVDGNSNYFMPITLNDCVMQSIIQLNSSCSINVRGGNYRAMAFRDTPTTQAWVSINGAGVSQDYTTGSEAIGVGSELFPFPAPLDGFVGNSMIHYEHRPYMVPTFRDFVSIVIGNTLGLLFPTSPLLTLGSINNDQPYVRMGFRTERGDILAYYDMKRNGLGVAGKIGWLQLLSNYFGDSVYDVYAGFDLKGGLEIAGSFSNDKVLTIPSSGGGAFVMDCSKSNSFVFTPTANNQTLTATGMRKNQNIKLVILTAGVVSYEVRFGTNFKAMGFLNSGTVSGAKFPLSFFSDGVSVIEDSGIRPGLGFTPGQIASNVLVYEAKSITGIADGASLAGVTWKDRGRAGLDATFGGTPTFETNEFGDKPIVRMNATNLSMVNLPDLSAYKAGTLIIPWDIVTTGNGGNIMGTNNAFTQYYPYNPDQLVYDNFGSNTRRDAIAPLVNMIGYRHVYTAYSTADSWGFFQNRSSRREDNDTHIVGFPAAPKIGYSGDFYVNGKLGAIYFFSDRLTSAEMTAMWDYIKREMRVG